MSDKVLNKSLFKKWQFWVGVVLILGLVGLVTPDTSTDTANSSMDDTNTSQAVGTLPVLVSADYTDKEGLVVFKDLDTKGYTVTAEYINEEVPATNQEFTEQFTNADATSCSDRLGFDAYLVSGLTQNGDNVSIILTNEATNNQTCPAGTTNDL